MTRAEIEDVIRCGVENKENISDIARQCNTSRHTVYKYMQRMGLEYKGQRSYVDVNQLTEMLKSGKTYEEIAESYGLTKKAIQYHIAKNNLKGVSVQSRQQKRAIEKAKQEKQKKEVKKVEKKPEKQEVNYAYCRQSTSCKMKRNCLYGGKFGNIDCCDYFELTGKRRQYEKGNPEHCYCFQKATDSEKEKYRCSVGFGKGGKGNGFLRGGDEN